MKENNYGYFKEIVPEMTWMAKQRKPVERN